MPKHYLGRSQIAERLGLTDGTIASYYTKGMLPEPDVVIGKPEKPTYGWLPETIDTWQASRPGKGGRPRKEKA